MTQVIRLAYHATPVTLQQHKLDAALMQLVGSMTIPTNVALRTTVAWVKRCRKFQPALLDPG